MGILFNKGNTSVEQKVQTVSPTITGEGSSPGLLVKGNKRKKKRFREFLFSLTCIKSLNTEIMCKNV